MVAVFVGAIAGIKSAAFGTNLHARTTKAAARLAESLAVPLWGFDDKACDQIVLSELSDGDMDEIYLRENTGTIFTAFGRSGTGGKLAALSGDPAEEARYASAARARSVAPVKYRDLTIGEVTVYARGADSLRGLGLDITEQALIALLEGAIVAFLAFVAADRLVSRRVLRLGREIGRFSERDLEARSLDAGPDEIGELAGEFNAMADTIQRHAEGLGSAVAERTRELAEANRDLEDANERLSETISELRRAQDEVVESRRIAALGQLVAGIAHQLNSPLAAIASANRFLADDLQGRILRISRQLAGIDEVDAAILDEMLSESMAGGDTVDFSLLRARKREFAARFAEAGFADPEGLADTVVDANIHGLGSRLLEFLGNKRTRDILSVVEAVNDIRNAGLVINSASERASSVVRALKVYIGQTREGEKSSLNVATCVEEVLGLFRVSTRNNLVLVTDLDRGLRVSGRREQLDLVWLNLVDNAVQAMSGRGRLEIFVGRSGNSAVVRVSDTGRGVPAEIRDHVFDPFFATGRHAGGLGLGLPTAKRIVEDHGGTLAFESEAGRTVFTVVLPAEAEAPGA